MIPSPVGSTPFSVKDILSSENKQITCHQFNEDIRNVKQIQEYSRSKCFAERLPAAEQCQIMMNEETKKSSSPNNLASTTYKTHSSIHQEPSFQHTNHDVRLSSNWRSFPTVNDPVGKIRSEDPKLHDPRSVSEHFSAQAAASTLINLSQQEANNEQVSKTSVCFNNLSDDFYDGCNHNYSQLMSSYGDVVPNSQINSDTNFCNKVFYSKPCSQFEASQRIGPRLTVLENKSLINPEKVNSEYIVPHDQSSHQEISSPTESPSNGLNRSVAVYEPSEFKRFENNLSYSQAGNNVGGSIATSPSQSPFQSDASQHSTFSTSKSSPKSICNLERHKGLAKHLSGE